MEQGQERSKSKMIIWMIVILTGLPVVGLLVASVYTYTMPKLYESTATVELVPSGRDVEAWGAEQYLQTEIEVMRSQETYLTVVEMKQLDVRWGLQINDAAARLSQVVQIQRVDGGGRMVKVICRYRLKEDAQAVCEGVYKSYQYRKSELRLERIKGELAGLSQEIHVLGNQIEGLELELSHADGSYQGDLTSSDGGRAAEVIRKDLEKALKKKKALDAESVIAKRSAANPSTALIVHEVPQISHYAVSPNIPLNQSIGLGLGLIIALVVDGILLVILLKEQKNAQA